MLTKRKLRPLTYFNHDNLGTMYEHFDYLDDEIEDLADKINNGEKDIAKLNWEHYLGWNISVLKHLISLITSKKNRNDIIDCAIKQWVFFRKLNPELELVPPYSNFEEDCQELKKLIADDDDFDIALPNGDVASRQSQNNACKNHPTSQIKLMDIPHFKDLIQMFVDAGFIEVDGLDVFGNDTYKWKQKNQLAYFAELVSDKLKLSNRQNGDKRQINWKPFERLFKENNLRFVRHDYAKNDSKPSRANEIERLIDEWYDSHKQVK